MNSRAQPMYVVKTFASFSELPDHYEGLLSAAAKTSFYLSPAWFDNLERTTGQRLRLYGVETSPGGRPEALFVTRRESSPGHGRTLASCTNIYSILYGPVCRPDSCDMRDIAQTFAAMVRAERPRWASIGFDALDLGPGFDRLVEAFRAQGMLVQRYFHFGVQYENVSHGSYEEYLRQRPSTLRNTLKRKAKKLWKMPGARLALYDKIEHADEFMAAYDSVYAASWKRPEPFPEFTPGLVRAAAVAGCLRAGVVYLDGEPAAAQIWIVAGGRATIYKLAYVQDHANLSIGSILTAEIMRRVIEVDRVSEVDFGRGDDPYKADWFAQRRERWGFIAFNPRTLRGLLGAARHIGGGRLKRALMSMRPVPAERRPRPDTGTNGESR